MAILTLAIGFIIFGIGIAGQIYGVRKTREFSAGDRRGGRIVVTVGSIVVGGWLLIYSTVHLLHSHMMSR
jgi:hypothetical protein